MLKDHSEGLNNIKMIHSETKYTLIEIKNNLQGNKSRVDKAKNQINDLEHKGTKSNQSEQQEEKWIKKKNEHSISNFWDTFKCSNIHITGMPEGEEKEQGIGNLFEIIVEEKFPNLVKEVDMQVQEAQGSPKQDRCKEAHSKTHHNKNAKG